MIKYCLAKWEKNKDALNESLRNDAALEECDYLHLVKKVVSIILNDGETGECWDDKWSVKNITEIDNGDYCGTLLYLIPRDTYEPSEYDYLMAYAGYGSCSGCDTLKHVQSLCYDEESRRRFHKEVYNLCKDIVCSMIKPYNSGWRHDSEFDPVEDQ